MKRNSKKAVTNSEDIVSKHKVIKQSEEEEEDRHPAKPKGNNFKSYKEGFHAAKKGQTYVDCPYDLEEDAKKILLKRDRWLRGFEEFAFRKKSRKEILKGRKTGFRIVGKTRAYGVGYVVFDNEEKRN